MGEITVKISFLGTIAAYMGTKERWVTLHTEREKALEEIKNLVKEKAGDQVLFTMLVNGSSFELNSKPFFEETDEFIVIPIVLGG